jgi:prolipoprotein diacylglyceryltransferase
VSAPAALRLAADPRRAFRRSGALGAAVGLAVVVALAPAAGLPVLPAAALALAALPAFALVATVMRAFQARPTLIHYRDFLLTLAVEAGLARAAGLPVLRALDVVVLGIGAFAACGRLGCLAAGCCHGRPWIGGVRYGPAHVRNGFPRALLGVPLFPVQAVESAWIALAVAAGAVSIASGAPAGTTLGLYLSLYAAGRFALELARGDAARGHAAGFSHAQWTSLAVAMGIALASSIRVLPPSPAWWAPLAAIALAMAILAHRRRADPGERHRLVSPSHLSELAGALARLERNARMDLRDGNLRVARTSAGVRLSAGVEDRRLRHLSFSRADRPLTAADADALARTLARLRPGRAPAEVVAGAAGVYHLVFAAGER